MRLFPTVALRLALHPGRRCASPPTTPSPPKPELPDQSQRAVPARRQCRHHRHPAIAPLSPRLAKRVRLPMRARVPILHPPIVSSPHQQPVRVEHCRANRNPTLRQPGPRLVKRNLQHRRVRHRHHLVLSPRSITTIGNTKPTTSQPSPGIPHTPNIPPSITPNSPSPNRPPYLPSCPGASPPPPLPPLSNVPPPLRLIAAYSPLC